MTYATIDHAENGFIVTYLVPVEGPREARDVGEALNAINLGQYARMIVRALRDADDGDAAEAMEEHRGAFAGSGPDQPVIDPAKLPPVFLLQPRVVFCETPAELAAEITVAREAFLRRRELHREGRLREEMGLAVPHMVDH